MDYARGRRKSHKFYRPIVAWFIACIAGMVQRMPRRCVLALGEAFGVAMFRLAGKTRRLAAANLRDVYADASAKWVVDTCRRCFVTFGRSLMETLRLPALSDDELRSLISCQGYEHIEEALARGRGVLILSAHVGAWEMLAAWLGLRTGRPFHAIGRRISEEAYNELLVNTRLRVGVETVYQDDSPRRPLGVLRKNKPLGILADQDIPHLDSVFVSFFGRPAFTPTAPVSLARASGAALVPVMIVWSGRRHHIIVCPAVEVVRSGDRKADAIENTQRWSDVVEAVIRDHPDQWAWFHHRWRTQPTD